MAVKLTFLGTGTSQGVPMIGCSCEVCTSTDPRDKRLRTSALVQVWPSQQGAEGSPDSGCGGSGSGEISGSGNPDRTAGGNCPKRDQGDSSDEPKIDTRGDGCGDPVNIVIDAGPDFRTQMLAAGVAKLDAILLTHEHKDHTGGIDDVRAYNYFSHAPVDIWATERVQRTIRKDYDYAFAQPPYPGAPEITLHTIPDGSCGGDPETRDGSFDCERAPAGCNSGERFNVHGVSVVPIHGLHMKLPVTGFRIGGLAYLTDFNYLTDSELAKLRGVDTLVVNAIGHVKHISHFNLEEAIELGRKIGARRTFLTHMAHRMGRYADLQPTLPEGVFMAYDGLCVDIGE